MLTDTIVRSAGEGEEEQKFPVAVVAGAAAGGLTLIGVLAAVMFISRKRRAYQVSDAPGYQRIHTEKSTVTLLAEAPAR